MGGCPEDGDRSTIHCSRRTLNAETSNDTIESGNGATDIIIVQGDTYRIDSAPEGQQQRLQDYFTYFAEKEVNFYA